MNAVSFSLFGTAPIYLTGAIRNAELYPHFFPDFKCVFYVERESIPFSIRSKLAELGADVRPYYRAEYPNGMFPRFTISDDPTVERFIVRDVDSRPSQREVNAVNAWIASDKAVHIMRDHPLHCSLAMGGMWGAVSGVLKDVEANIKTFRRSRQPYTRNTTYGADQDFLVQYLWPKARTNSLIHDSFCRHGMTGVPFPDGLSEGDFVGSIYSETEEPNAEHIKLRDEWIREARP